MSAPPWQHSCIPRPCSKHRAFRPHGKHPRTMLGEASVGLLLLCAPLRVPAQPRPPGDLKKLPCEWLRSWSVYGAASRARQETDLSHPFRPILQRLLLPSTDQWGNEMGAGDKVSFSSFLTVQNPNPCPPGPEASWLCWVCCVHVERID